MNRQQQTKLRSLIKREEDEDNIIEILSSFDPNTFIIDGSLLNYGTIYNRPRVTKTLLERGADPNALYEGDYTPLMAAVDNKNPEMVRLLLKHGADPNIADRYGNQALWKATFNYEGDISMIKSLLDFKADPFHKNNAQKSPYDLAKQNDREELLELFKKK